MLFCLQTIAARSFVRCGKLCPCVFVHSQRLHCLARLLWIGCKLLLPLGAAWMLLGQKPLWTLWPGLAVQYALLWQFAQPVARLNGIHLGGLGGFAYLFEAAVWPLGITLLQLLVLWAVRKAAVR